MIHRDKCKHCDHYLTLSLARSGDQVVLHCCQCHRLAKADLEPDSLKCIHGVLYPVHGMNGTSKEVQPS